MWEGGSSSVVVLELPLAVGRNVASREKALELVGGANLGSAVTQGSVTLDYGSSPVSGQVVSVTRPRYVVAVLVSRKRKRVVDAEIVGRVRHRVHFWDCPGDFAGPVPRRYGKTSSKARSGAYGLKEWPDGKKSSLSAQRARAGEPPPSKPTPTALLLASAFEDEPRLKAGIDKARDLLARRPVWRRQRLAHELRDDLTSTELSSILPVVAYELLGGPWRRTWVRFGHVPSQDPRSRFLQVIEQRPPQRDEDDKGKKKKRIHGTFVQLCDLDHREAQDAVLNAPRRSAVSDHGHSGWFDRSFFDDVLPPILDRPTEDRTLAWREFLDVAAVADLQTNLIDDDHDERPHDDDLDDDDDDAEVLPEDERPADEFPHDSEAAPQDDDVPIAQGRPNTAFTLLEDDDDDDDDD